MTATVSPTNAPALPDALTHLAEGPQSLAQLLVAIRRHLHQHPEVGMNEHDTSHFIRNTLKAYGLDVHGPVAGTGLYVDIEGDAAGGAVGYRADIDALPAQDQKNVPYRSRTPNVAHLCGHDAHAAIAIGVALVLDAHRDKINGRVRVFFQPNEEGLPSGAPLMIRSGVLEGLNGAYAIHVDPTLDVGRYGLIVGPATASSDRFDVYVRQEGTGHSARPHEGVDTVWVAAQIMHQFYQIADRVTDVRSPAILTATRMAGAEAHNVIPEEASFGGTLRTVSPEDRTTIREYMHRTVQRFGDLHDAHVNLSFEDGSPPVMNDATAITNVESTIQEAFGKQAIHWIDQSSMGGEDFAHYLKHVPGALIRVGTASGPDTTFPLHHHRFDIDETPLAPTSRLMARVLINHLTKNLTADVDPVRSDFSAADNGRVDPT
ncbi:MAG: amidohydrolase [Salinibacter sp.]